MKQRFRKEHRYPGREDEVAARIVNKQRADFGETQAARQEEADGRVPDRSMPLPGYRHLSVDQVVRQLDGLKQPEIRRIRSYEERHKKRTTLLEELDKRLAA